MGRILATLFFLLVFSSNGLAQRSFGVVWEVPSEPEVIRQQLREFKELGITYIEVNEPITPTNWQIISGYEFNIFARLPIYFPVAQSFTENNSAKKNALKQLIGEYATQRSIKAIGLFSYGHTSNPAFRDTLSTVIEEVRSVYSGPLYYHSAKPEPDVVQDYFSFKIQRISNATFSHNSTTGGFFYQPDEPNRWKLKQLKTFLNNTATQADIPIFFEASWLKSMLQQHPGFGNTLRLYATTQNPVFALPNQQGEQFYGHNSVIAALIIAWFIFALTYYISPVYRKALVRYFTGHTFYIDDVLKRHVRTFLPGISLFIQHALAGGIVMYCFFYTGFSSLGAETLFYHFPFLSFFNAGANSILILGFTVTLAIEIICIIWLWLALPSINYLYQVFNLYPWSLQINVPLATITLVLFLTGMHWFFIFSTAAIFLLIFIASFFITSMDGVRYANAAKFKYLAASAGLYTVVILGVIIWISLSDKLINIIDLAASLPM